MTSDLLTRDEKKDLLRLVTAGSVDDGKSTLIGRLLFESKGIYEDQLAALESAAARRGRARGEIDLAFLTDGLKAEREQGITIDVAYRYFSTPRRKFIIADTPGHEQYTRNMATGASTADLAIILVDASQGLLTQSRRHAFIASLLRIPHVVVAVNKMDLVDWSEGVFENIQESFADFAARLELNDVEIIPLSALSGDNVVTRSEKMPWYQGATLLHHLESVHVASDRNLIDLRFPVQLVSRPSSRFRGYMGTPASGIIRPGDEVMVLPSGVRSHVSEVLGPSGPLDEGYPPVPITVTLADEVDVSRGDVLVKPQNVPHVDRAFEAMMVWMSEEPLDPGRTYTLKHATRSVAAVIPRTRYRIDVNTLHRQGAETLTLNEIGRCVVETARPLVFDSYARNHTTGAFILIDRRTNGTVAAGMILDREASELVADPEAREDATAPPHVLGARGQVTPDERRERLEQEPTVVWLTGLPGSGKSTIAHALERRLFDLNRQVVVLDGGNVRLGLSRDLGFSANDRAEHVRRVAEVAAILSATGAIVVVASVSPYSADRERARGIIGEERWVEVHVNASADVCASREERYGLAESGEIPAFTGVTAPYEAPTDPALRLETDDARVDVLVDSVVDLLERRGTLR